MNTVSLNKKYRLFVVSSPAGTNFIGFDTLFQKLTQVTAALGLPVPVAVGIGTLAQYEEFVKLERVYRTKNNKELLFEPGTLPEVAAILRSGGRPNSRIRLYYGDTTTGLAWLNEDNLIGTIRSSAGIRAPVLVCNGKEGGGEVLSASIVRIQDCKTKEDLYCHPRFSTPEFTIVDSSEVGVSEVVMVEGRAYAAFEKPGQAQKWVEYMQGLRMRAY